MGRKILSKAKDREEKTSTDSATANTRESAKTNIKEQTLFYTVSYVKSSIRMV